MPNLKKYYFPSFFLAVLCWLSVFLVNTSFVGQSALLYDSDELRQLYSQPTEKWPKPHIDKGVKFEEIGLLPEVQFPENNSFSKEKAALGKALFFDPRLSKSGQIACASCHDPDLGWGDGRRVAFGHDRKQGTRNASTILNVGYVDKLFWDGRAHTLEQQALFPIQDHLEMNASPEELEQKLNGIETYQKMFKEVFGSEKITLYRVSQAIATFERTIKSRTSRFDLFLKGKQDALSDTELLGLHLFRTKARCINCHSSPLFSDNQFHNDGFTFFGRTSEDLGRYLITERPEDLGAFRTPSLRDVVFTGPWMHTGTMASLEEIIEMYNLGMPQPIPESAKDRPLLPKSSPLLKPLALSKEEKAALLAFLHAISARPQSINPPDLPH